MINSNYLLCVCFKSSFPTIFQVTFFLTEFNHRHLGISNNTWNQIMNFFSKIVLWESWNGWLCYRNMLAQTCHPWLGKQAGVVEVTILSYSVHIYKIVMCLLQQTFHPRVKSRPVWGFLKKLFNDAYPVCLNMNSQMCLPSWSIS